MADTACYGDYYQWGRDHDGHQESGSATTTVLASSLDTSSNANYIKSSVSPYEWLDVNIDESGSLRAANWSKTDGTSVCPVGYRVPSMTELENETGDVTNNIGAFNHFLKFPSAGSRTYTNGSVATQGTDGPIWSSTASTAVLGTSEGFFFNSANAGTYSTYGRASGNPVRCIKD